MVAKLKNYLTVGIWNLRLGEIAGPKAFGTKLLRIVLISLRGFVQNDCALRASALTFYTLLSIVPVVAMAFGIAKGFGFENLLEKEILTQFASQQEVGQRIIEFARSLLENTKGGLIAGIGIVLLLWTVLKVLSHIEGTFNNIWMVKSRSFDRKFADYLAIMLISPLLIILSSSVTVYIQTSVAAITGRFEVLELVGPMILFLIKLLPYCLLWLLFSMIYVLMPNTKVNFSSGVIAGILAGTTFQLLQMAYIDLQILMAKYNAIYGSFAALPLFLIWLQASWLIVLTGAEVSYAHQNHAKFEFLSNRQDLSWNSKKKIGLLICHYLIKRFIQADQPADAIEIARQLRLPIQIVESLLDELKLGGIISAVDAGNHRGYQPARDVNGITIQSVVDALEERGVNDLNFQNLEMMSVLEKAFEKLRSQINNSQSNILLKSLDNVHQRE
jgi:membrane protein